MDVVNGLVSTILGKEFSDCRFCRIAAHQSDLEKDVLLFEDEEIVVFHDHQAAARHHLLVVPKTHIRDCRCLLKEHLPLLDRLTATGKFIMESRLNAENASSEAYNDIKMGFHFPPKISVPHLHLHVIAPYSQLIKTKAHRFSRGYFWFVSPDFVKYQIEKKGRTTPSISPEDVRKYQRLEKWLLR